MTDTVSKAIYDELWKRCQQAERKRDFLKHRVRELEEELFGVRRHYGDMARNKAQRRAAAAFSGLTGEE